MMVIHHERQMIYDCIIDTMQPSTQNTGAVLGRVACSTPFLSQATLSDVKQSTFLSEDSKCLQNAETQRIQNIHFETKK